jgi:hypothetical protein
MTTLDFRAQKCIYQASGWEQIHDAWRFYSCIKKTRHIITLPSSFSLTIVIYKVAPLREIKEYQVRTPATFSLAKDTLFWYMFWGSFVKVHFRETLFKCFLLCGNKNNLGNYVSNLLFPHKIYVVHWQITNYTYSKRNDMSCFKISVSNNAAQKPSLMLFSYNEKKFNG